jgi:hypothetical protein
VLLDGGSVVASLEHAAREGSLAGDWNTPDAFAKCCALAFRNFRDHVEHTAFGAVLAEDFTNRFHFAVAEVDKVLIGAPRHLV